MRTWFWASRNEDEVIDEINIHVRAKKPKRDKDCPEIWDLFFSASASEGDIEVCRKYFEKFTGIQLKPGECKKIQLSAKVIK